MHRWLTLNSSADLATLVSWIQPEFAPQQAVAMLKDRLSPDVKGVLLEYPYVDKDYRSTYYGFYAKKGLRYNPFCVRLHFFRQGVSLSQQFELCIENDRPEDSYFGYMILRPTEITPIGRTVLSVGARKDFRGAVIGALHKVHVLGRRLAVQGFPFMQQHTDISVCAHAACWSILRHYSQRFGRYAEFLVQDITRMAGEADPGGLAPSRGLAIDQACRVFSKAGLYPDVYSRQEFGADFCPMLHAYIESGFPLFAALGQQKHAIAVIGHGEPDRAGLQPKPEVQEVWDATNTLITMDDNLMPYEPIGELPSVPGPYKPSEIDTFIVPLPDKIYLPAEAVKRQALNILQHGFPGLDLSYIKHPVLRYFATTSANFKAYVMESATQWPTEFFTALAELVLPQFVWIVEVSGLTDWQNKRCNAIMVLDATASAHDDLPFFIVHDRNSAFVYDRGVTRGYGQVRFGRPLTNLSEFRRNLTTLF